MAEPGNTTTKLQHWLELLREGNDQARHELIGHACERLRKLTSRMLRAYPVVHRFEETSDVLQNSLLRLYRALLTVTPESLRHFYALAGLQIRRELLTLAKNYSHQQEQQEKLSSLAVQNADDLSNLLQWTEFHQQVDGLPEDEREVFSLIFYEDLSHAEVAAVLGVSVRTVIRRWQAARVGLHRALFRDGDGHDD